MRLSSAKLKSIGPAEIGLWLRTNGWDLENSQYDKMAVWGRDLGADHFEVLVPQDPSFRDYGRRLFEVVETLSEATGRPGSVILQELLATRIDVVRFRVAGHEVGDGAVPVEVAASLFQGAYDVLAAGALAAHRPASAYRGKPPAVAHFLKRTSVVAPATGSFVITVHSPLRLPAQMEIVPDPTSDPFERKAMRMMLGAIVAAQQAARAADDTDDGQPFLDASLLGVSANLCDALALLVGEGAAEGVDVQVMWAPARAVPAGTAATAHVEGRLAEVFRAGARLLRGHEPVPDFEVLGPVVQLTSPDVSQGGRVVIWGEVDGKPRKIRVPLPPGTYETAVSAHKAGDIVRCVGTLSFTGRQYQLVDVGRLDVVEGDSEEPA